MPVYFEGVGSVKALNTATVRAQVDGRLLSVNFKEGQDVKKGDVLAKIDPVTYQAQLDQAVAKKALDEALLANTRKDLERFQKVGTLAISQQQIDTQIALIKQQEAQVKSDIASIENAAAILGYTTIVAPFDGRTGIRLDRRRQSRSCGRSGRHRRDHAGAADLGGVHAAAAAAADADKIKLRRHAGRACAVDRQPDGTRYRHAQGHRQSGRSADRHDPSQGRIPERQAPALAGPVRQRSAARRYAQRRRRRADGSRAARVRTARIVYVVGADNTAEMRQVKISRQDEKFAVIAEGFDGRARKSSRAVSAGSRTARPYPSATAMRRPAEQAGDLEESRRRQEMRARPKPRAAACKRPRQRAPASPEAALVTGSTGEGGKSRRQTTSFAPG